MTVGLIAGEMRQRAERSLAHLLAQDVLEKLEILVVDVDRCRYDKRQAGEAGYAARWNAMNGHKKV